MIRAVIAASLVVGVGLFFLLCGDDTLYDLRGPGRKVGEWIREVSRTESDENVIEMPPKPPSVDRSMVVVSFEKLTKIEALDGTVPIVLRTNVVKSGTKVTPEKAGEAKVEYVPASVSGKTVISRFENGRWRHELETVSPFGPLSNHVDDFMIWRDNESIPTTPQKIGASWNVDDAQFRRFTGTTAGMETNIRQTFRRVVEFDGELCAELRSIGTIQGMTFMDGTPLNAKHELDITEWRSLSKGLTVKGEGTFSMKYFSLGAGDGSAAKMNSRSRAKLSWTASILR